MKLRHFKLLIAVFLLTLAVSLRCIIILIIMILLIVFTANMQQVPVSAFTRNETLKQEFKILTYTKCVSKRKKIGSNNDR